MRKKIKFTAILILLSTLMSQGIRLLANLYVARLLAPEMFGVMAIVQIIQQGVVMFSDVGIRSFVIRHKEYRCPAMLNTIWSIQVYRGWIMWLFLLFLATVLWFIQKNTWSQSWGNLNNKELPLLIAVMSFTALFSGYKSLADFVYSRELNILKLEIAAFISQICGVGVMIFWAWLSPSLWALASAGFVSTMVSLFLSYILFDIRHHKKWDAKVVSELYQFGKWIVIASTLTFLAQQGDRLFLSVNISEAELGLYSIALSLSLFITFFLNKISHQLWLPAFSEMGQNKKKLKKNFYRVRRRQDVFVGLSVIVFGVLAPWLIGIIYDERYSDVAWMLQLLLISVPIAAVSTTTKTLLIVIGETKVQTQVVLVKLGSLMALLYWMFFSHGLKGVIIATIVSNGSSLIPQIIKMRQHRIFFYRNELIVWMLLLIYTIIIAKEFNL